MGLSEAINQRRIDYAMAKRERTKRQTLIYKTPCRKLKIKQHEHTINRGELKFLGRVSKLCSICGVCGVTLVKNMMTSHE